MQLEQEVASIMMFALKAGGNPSPYYYDVPEQFKFPAMYFPQPEIITRGETFRTYASEYAWYINIMAETTEAAQEIGLEVLTQLKRARNLVPIVDEAEPFRSGGESLIYRLDLILEANAALPEEDRIRGLMADVEPYLLEDWDDEEGRADLLDRYAQGVETAYRYAQENGLELLLCVPSFYDSACPELLDRIVSDGCDGIAVMNYDRTDEYGQMADEVELAREHGKRVICIAELQAPGRHELTEINTYYGVGLRPLLASWEVLADRFDYSGLSFSYHYYAPLLELLEAGSGLSLPESPEA